MSIKSLQRIPLDLNSFHQPSHLLRAQTRHFSLLLLTDLLLQGLAKARSIRHQYTSTGSRPRLKKLLA